MCLKEFSAKSKNFLMQKIHFFDFFGLFSKIGIVNLQKKCYNICVRNFTKMIFLQDEGGSYVSSPADRRYYDTL